MRARGTWAWLTASLVAALQLAPPPVRACNGDCDGSATVTINELVHMVAVALGEVDLSACIAADVDGNGRISVAELVRAVNHALHGCPDAAKRRTVDDLFAAVAEQVPEFGGMFFGEAEQVLEVYLLDPSPENLDNAADAIVGTFGPVIPPGGLHARQGDYGFAELRSWYRAMVATVLAVEGVTATDINEAVNRLVIGVETPSVEPEVMLALGETGIPLEAVAVVVTGPIEPLAHTVRDQQSPRRGGFQIARLINNVAGFGLATPTIGFNATRGGVPGFVTNSHNSQVFWNLDASAGYPPADFYQSLFSPAALIGTESVDPQGFPCPPPYPATHRCRYSDSLFAPYNSGVAWDQGIIGKTTAQTQLSNTIANHVLAVDHSRDFTVVAPPSQPYLVGLQLHKVGRTTGWTSGGIQYAYFPSTCADFVDAQQRVRLCQYVMSNPPFGLATFGDSGSPVFRLIDSACGYVELYGIAWGGSQFFVPPPPWSGGSVGKMLVFSPIGGVPFQQSGVQSAQDLGPLSYQAAGTCNTPTPTTVQSCGFIGPRMCGGNCPGSTEVCQPLADDSGCVCRPRPTPIRPCGFVAPRMCGGDCPGSGEVCQPLPDDSGCVCRPQPTPTRTQTSGATETHNPAATVTPTPGASSTPTATPTTCGAGSTANLVLNPGFETYSSIPVTLSQLFLASPWISPTTGASPDYFHSLASASSSVGIPANTLGSQQAHGGNAYAGFHARPGGAYREYVEAPLSTPLVAGATYQISFFLALADHSNWAIDKVGAHLATAAIGPINTAYTLPVTPQIQANSYVTDKTGWTQILGFYNATGGEDHIVIGNFLDNTSSPPLTGQGGPFDFAYYYLDDVSVTLVEPTCTPTPLVTCPGAVCTPTRTATPTP